MVGYVTLTPLLIGCASLDRSPLFTRGADGTISPGPAAQVLPVAGAAAGPIGEIVGAGVLAALSAYAVYRNRRLKQDLDAHVNDSK